MSDALGKTALVGLRNGMNTIEIARLTGATEGDVYNSIELARYIERDKACDIAKRRKMRRRIGALNNDF